MTSLSNPHSHPSLGCARRAFYLGRDKEGRKSWRHSAAAQQAMRASIRAVLHEIYEKHEEVRRPAAGRVGWQGAAHGTLGCWLFGRLGSGLAALRMGEFGGAGCCSGRAAPGVVQLASSAASGG